MDEYSQLILIFTSIIYEALPFVVLGVVIAGLLEEFVPQQFITKIIPRNRVLAIALGGLLGLVFPMCECGIIPVMRRLLRKGLPLSVCTCYMLAGPIINVVVMLSTYYAFNPPNPEDYVFGGPINMVILRVSLGFLVAFNASLLVEWQYRKYGTDLLSPLVVRGLPASAFHAPGADQLGSPTQAEPGKNEDRHSLWQRINNITETALHDFIDIMAFLILGACLATTGRLVLDQMTGGIGNLVQEQKVIQDLSQKSEKSPVAGVADKQKKLAADTVQLMNEYRTEGPTQKALEKAAAAMKEAAQALEGNNYREADTQQGTAFKYLEEARAEAKKELLSNPYLAILLMMGIAIVFCLCSEADAFVAANFQTVWPPASKLAFLVLGPMLDIKLYLMYTRVFRPRLIFTIILAVVSQVFVYTLLVHYYWEDALRIFHDLLSACGLA